MNQCILVTAVNVYPLRDAHEFLQIAATQTLDCRGCWHGLVPRGYKQFSGQARASWSTFCTDHRHAWLSRLYITAASATGSYGNAASVPWFQNTDLCALVAELIMLVTASATRLRERFTQNLVAGTMSPCSTAE